MPGRRSLPYPVSLRAFTRQTLQAGTALAAALLLGALPSAQASTATRAQAASSLARSLPARVWTPKTTAAVTASPSARDRASDCPVPTSGEASAPAPGAPTNVRAIGGDGSVTVTWCAPVAGQGNVSSYTVTAPDGTQVSSPVPNNWAIVDGLSNGKSYSFTVQAKTTSGSTGATSAASNTVTTAPIAPPRDVLLGKPQSVTYDQYSLMIGGKRTMIYSGEFDPWRLPSPSLWIDRLEKMKADGFNAVTPYFDWDYHSSAPGQYDFSGVRDINTFLNDAQKVGLYVIARPGPYINAETDAGGFPGWLVTQQGTARTDAPDYVAAAKQWLSEIDPIIAAHQITRGGDVILYQVENELFYNEPATVNYMADLIAKVKAGGINVPLTGNHSGTYNGTPGAVDIDGYDSYPQGFNCADPNSFGTPGGFSPFAGEPLMLPEFQGGSYDSWGGSGYDNCYEMTNSDFENVFYKSNVADGVTIQSNYMTVGGTNWGWLPAPFMYTSYDYGSAIRESGEIGTPSDPDAIAGSKYGENKLLGDFLQSVPSLTNTQGVGAPTSSNSAVATEARGNPDDHTQMVYLRQQNASSTSDVSTHLALNTVPSFSYSYDDTDPALSYTGSWSPVANQSYTGGDYKNTESFSDVTGDSMSVTFTGTAVQYIAPTANNHGYADVYLDGTKVATVDGYSPGTDFQQVLYSASGLADTTHTLKIVVTGQKDAASGGTYVSVDAINVPTAAQAADYYPTVPQQPGTSITLQGRDARLLLTNFAFDGEQMQYSTSELMTDAQIGNRAVALLYGPSGTDGETVLRYDSQPTVNVIKGSVQSSWDSSRGDLRLDYTHSGLAEVQITGGGRPPLLLLLADKNTAEEFWPESTSAGPALVEGGYLVRTADSHTRTLALTGDTSSSGPIAVWAPSGIANLTWNGQRVNTTSQSDGSLAGTLPGPASVNLPTLSRWRFRFETPEAQPFYDDSSWTLADHPTTTNPTPPVTTPVLYADDYGFHHGFIWYRGHFTATGSETGITLTANGGSHGAFSVWLNGAFIGSDSSGNQQTQTFSFPAAAIHSGADNVVAVLVQSSSHDEDGVYGSPPADGQKSPRGLMGAKLNGGSETVTWRLEGNQGGERLQDPVRGPLNATGLYGTNHGWDLPGFPDDSWQSVSLPDDWNSRGVPEGIGWYRTTFSLVGAVEQLQPDRGPARQPAQRPERRLARVHLHQRMADRPVRQPAGAADPVLRSGGDSQRAGPEHDRDRRMGAAAKRRWAGPGQARLARQSGRRRCGPAGRQPRLLGSRVRAADGGPADARADLLEPARTGRQVVHRHRDDVQSGQRAAHQRDRRSQCAVGLDRVAGKWVARETHLRHEPLEHLHGDAGLVGPDTRPAAAWPRRRATPPPAAALGRCRRGSRSRCPTARCRRATTTSASPTTPTPTRRRTLTVSTATEPRSRPRDSTVRAWTPGRR